MAQPTRPASHRRRFLIGLAVAALLGVGIGAVLVAGARAAERRERAERQAVVTLSALAAVVDRASAAAAEEAEAPAPADEGGFGLGDELAALDAPAEETTADAGGEAVRRAVARFAAEHPEVAAIRVLKFDGRLLEASTDPEDRGEKAAPRALNLDEKAIFDLGQKIRAAVEGNREGAEGAARAPEIAVERRAGGVLVLAAPVERGGAAVGMVQIQTRAEAEPAAFAWLPFLAAWLAPVLLLLLLSLALGERRWLLAAAAALLLVAALVGFGRWASGALRAERQASAEAVAARVAREAERAEALLADLQLPAGRPLEPTLWDVDDSAGPAA